MKSRINYMSLIGVFLVTGIIIMANIIANYMVIRVDLTKNNIYSLSKASKKMLKNLDERINIKCYFSKNLSPEYANSRNYLKDLLMEYKSYSRGKVNYTFVSYSDEEKLMNEARSYGIPVVQLPDISKDKFGVKISVIGLVMLYEDTSEVIPIVQNIEGLEYDLSSRIRKLTRETKKKIGFAKGYGMLDLLGSEERIKHDLEQQYDVVSVPLEEGATLQQDLDALFLLGPKEEISEETLFAVDQYFMSGKPLMIAVNGFNIDMAKFSAVKINSGIEKLLGSYAVRLEKGMVIDRQAQNISINQSRGYFTVQTVVPYLYASMAKNLNRKNPIVKNLNAISPAFCKALSFDEEKGKDIDFEYIAKSSKFSWVKKNLYTIAPAQRGNLAPAKDEKMEPHVLAATLKGRFSSYFADRAAPEKFKDMDIIKESPENHMLVVGSGYMFDRKYPMIPSNINFLLNSIDWLVQDEGLISIRTKNIGYNPIGEVKGWARALFKYSNMLLMPILISLYGLIRRYMRKNYRLRIKQEVA